MTPLTLSLITVLILYVLGYAIALKVEENTYIWPFPSQKYRIEIYIPANVIIIFDEYFILVGNEFVSVPCSYNLKRHQVVKFINEEVISGSSNNTIVKNSYLLMLKSRTEQLLRTTRFYSWPKSKEESAFESRPKTISITLTGVVTSCPGFYQMLCLAVPSNCVTRAFAV